jgi:hypothetical protein
VVEVEDVREGQAVVELVAGFGEVVEVEALQHHVEEFGHFDEPDASLRPHLFAAEGAVIEIFLVQDLRLDVPLQAELDAAVVDLFVDVFDYQDDVLEDLVS